MKAYDVLELAGRNLKEAIVRSSLTTIGISVGVASLVAMLSLGIGLQQLATKRLGRSGLFDTIVVTSKDNWRSADERREQPTINTGETRSLDEAARADIQKLAHVAEVYPEIRFTAEIRADDKPHIGFVGGLPQSAKANEALDDLQGSFFSGDQAPEAILQADFARELLNAKPPADPDQKLSDAQVKALLGKELVLRYAERQTGAGTSEADQMFGFSVVRKEQTLKIVGIINNEPYGGMRATSRARVFIPNELAEKMNVIQPADLRQLTRPNAGKTYLDLLVRMDSPKDVQTAQDAIKKMGFSTFSVLDAAKSLRRFFAVLDLFLGIFGSLALAVASLGIINTLVMAILERRREIGIMKAIGADDRDIKTLFFAEAGAMGAAGGAFGVALGWLIGRIINVGTNIYLHNQGLPSESFWLVPWWLVFWAILFAVLVSLGAGLYPASRAARLDPVEALRHD